MDSTSVYCKILDVIAHEELDKDLENYNTNGPFGFEATESRQKRCFRISGSSSLSSSLPSVVLELRRKHECGKLWFVKPIDQMFPFLEFEKFFDFMNTCEICSIINYKEYITRGHIEVVNLS